jgi:hypothetical protein
MAYPTRCLIDPGPEKQTDPIGKWRECPERLALDLLMSQNLGQGWPWPCTITALVPTE